MLLRRSSGEFEGDRDTVTDGFWFALAATGVATARRGRDMVFVEGTTLSRSLVIRSGDLHRARKRELTDNRSEKSPIKLSPKDLHDDASVR